MGYSTIRDVINLMANALTSGVSPPQPSGRQLLNDIDISKTFRANNIDPILAGQFITYADQEIDADLSEMYRTPFCQKAHAEFKLAADISEYNLEIHLKRCGSVLHVGDVLVFLEGTQKEEGVIADITSDTSISIIGLEVPLMGMYNASNTRVLNVRYPQIISLCSARIAAAGLFDKLFSAQVNPGISEYGKHLRELSRRDINNVINGRTILHGQKRIGHRFFNPTLRDRYHLPGGMDTDQTRNIEPPSGQ